MEEFSRTELLIKKEGIETLQSSTVAVFGVGGVGGVGVARRGCPAWIDYHNGGTMSTQFFCIHRQPQGVYPVRLAFSAVRVGLSAVSTCPFCAMASRGVVMVFLPPVLAAHRCSRFI